MAIRIIITGGTFDKQYDEIEGTLTFKDTHLPEILKRVRVTEDVSLQVVQLMDSLDMIEQNREDILKACINAPEQKIIITHGTDTMAETARVIGAAGIEKTVVLTGAMVPYMVHNSDSEFNLGSAFTAVSLLPNGVYIVMNGRVFNWDNVRKDKGAGVFREL